VSKTRDKGQRRKGRRIKIYWVELRKMDTKTFIEKFREIFASDILEIIVKNEKRVFITVRPGSIISVADHLFRKEGLRFIIATALQSKKGFEIYYHFSNDNSGLILNIHVILDKYLPQIESLSNMFNASNWIEREIHELFGINFLNHPNQDKLLSEGNWSEGVYPMRTEIK
jgi:NADH-quinone oxidoreductase subunit C